MKRIHDTAMRLNVTANNGGNRLDLVLTRYDIGMLRSLLSAVFGEIGGNPVLVSSLNQLVERCAMADDAISRIASFELLPRDGSRSYSMSSGSVSVH